MKKYIVPLVSFFVGVTLCFLLLTSGERKGPLESDSANRSMKSEEKAKKQERRSINLKERKEVAEEFLVPEHSHVVPPRGRQFTLITGRLVNESQPYGNCRMFLKANSETAPVGFDKRETPTFFDRTDDDGRFLFAVTNPGRYTIGVAKHIGGRPMRFSQLVFVRNEKNEVKDLGDLVVTQNAAIYGRVTNPEGIPLPYISVIARVGEKVLLRTLTGPDGSYRLGFAKRSEAVEILFLPRSPFKEHFKSSKVTVKKNQDFQLLDQVLEERSRGVYSKRVFLYTKLLEPKDKKLQSGPDVYVFQSGRFLFEGEITYKEGVGSVILHLDPGKYYVCLKIGSNLSIGRHIVLEKEEFQAFELTEYDVVPHRMLNLEFDITNNCQQHSAKESLFKVGFFEPKAKTEEWSSIFPRFPISSDKSRLSLKLPVGIPLFINTDLSLSVHKEDRFLGPTEEGSLKIRAKCVLTH